MNFKLCLMQEKKSMKTISSSFVCFIACAVPSPHTNTHLIHNTDVTTSKKKNKNSLINRSLFVTLKQISALWLSQSNSSRTGWLQFAIHLKYRGQKDFRSRLQCGSKYCRTERCVEMKLKPKIIFPLSKNNISKFLLSI